jgi:outer membrane protein assembly factor BamA
MKESLAKYVLCLIILFQCSASNAQTVFFDVRVVDSINISKILPLKKDFATKTQCINYIEQLRALLKAKGYISSSIDSIRETEKGIVAFLFVGNLYVWKNLVLPDEVKSFANQSSKNYSELPETILNYYENNGYPFAKVGFDSIVIDDKNEISALLKIDKGIEYKIDSIRVFGNANISNRFLKHYLKIANASLYSREKLERVNTLINQLGYLNSNKNWDILMLSRSCLLNLYLQSKNINKFDAIFGFLPNNQQNDGKLLFTVDAKLSLYNAFAKGERIIFNWQQIQPQSPRIDIGFSTPYIFNSDAGLDFNFNLYKRDSAYLNIATDIGLTYLLSNKTSFKIFISNLSTRIIQPDTAYIITNKKLPSVLDLSIVNIGAEYFLNNTKGTKLNKLSGFEIKLNVGFGQKKIMLNNTITSLKTDGFNYAGLYDSVAANSYQLKCKIAAAKYFSISKQSVIKVAANFGLIQTQNYLQNELFQIGGFKLLRGFDEENIFTSQYIVGSLEYRYLIARNSYFFAFSDGGYTKNQNTSLNYSYFGNGLGLAFETKQGILNISFAAGKRNDLPFNLRETKIHIGLVSSF